MTERRRFDFWADSAPIPPVVPTSTSKEVIKTGALFRQISSGLVWKVPWQRFIVFGTPVVCLHIERLGAPGAGVVDVSKLLDIQHFTYIGNVHLDFQDQHFGEPLTRVEWRDLVQAHVPFAEAGEPFTCPCESFDATNAVSCAWCNSAKFMTWLAQRRHTG